MARSYRYAVPSDTPMAAGDGPTGMLQFVAIPAPTYAALAAKAAERGMSVAQALAHALDAFFKSPKE